MARRKHPERRITRPPVTEKEFMLLAAIVAVVGEPERPESDYVLGGISNRDRHYPPDWVNQKPWPKGENRYSSTTGNRNRRRYTDDTNSSLEELGCGSSIVLSNLRKKGLVECSDERGYITRGYEYIRITQKGLDVLREYIARAEPKAHQIVGKR